MAAGRMVVRTVRMTQTQVSLNLLSLSRQVWANMAWRGIGALVRGGFASLLLGYMGATLVLMHTHFEQDVTFMTVRGL